MSYLKRNFPITNSMIAVMLMCKSESSVCVIISSSNFKDNKSSLIFLW